MPIVLAGVFFITYMVRADSVVVNDPSGAVTDDSLCSLPEAILDSFYPGEIAYQDCTSVAGSNTIELSTNVTLTSVYALDENSDPNGLPCLGEGAIVDGNGYTVERDSGASEFRIFCTQNGVNVTFQDITIKGGNVSSGGNGGGFRGRNIVSLTLEDVTFESNSAENGGAIGLDSLPGGGSTVVIDDSYFTGNVTDGLGSDKGGVLYSVRSDITVTDSYFYFNRPTTTSGGVFYVESTESELTVERSTFENNIAGKGAVFYIKNGATLSVSNSTFDTNSPIDDGGIIYSFQDTGVGNEISFFYNSAQFNNGGSSGGQTFYNCIDDGFFNCITGVGDSTLVGNLYFFENNILAGGGCDGNIDNAIFTNNLGGGFGLTCGTNDSPTNLAGSTALNGGLWKTFSITSGSNAIDTGSSGTLGCPDVDGRGRSRPFGSACDIGAYEFDEVGITLTESSGSTSVLEEGETSDTVDIFIESFPTSSVTITPSYDSSEISVSPSSLTFATSSWPETKTFTITAVDDNDDDDDLYTKTIEFNVSSGDLSYNNFSLSSLSVNLTDNDLTTSSGGGTTSPSNPAPVIPPVIPTVPPVVPIIPVIPPVIPTVPPVVPIIIPEIQEPVTPPTPDVLPVNTEETPSLENDNPNNINNKVAILSEKIFIKPLIKASDYINENVSIGAQKAVTVTGIATPVLIFVVSNPGVVTNTISLPLRLLNLIPVWLGLKRRRRPWGTVYDANTKQPLDPVFVTLKDLNGNIISETITDLDGRFGFLVAPGAYTISTKKGNYVFPSNILSGKIKDELYENLYFGEPINVTQQDEILVKNIPMDQSSFNWNEYEKKHNPKLMRFYSRFEIILSKISGFLFWTGFVSNLYMLKTFGFNTLNIFILSIYVLFFILRIFGVKMRKPGYIFDKNGVPVSLGLVRVYSNELNVLIAKAVIGKTGRYYVLLPKGVYRVEVLKKTGDSSYEQVLNIGSISLRNGYLSKNFKTE